MSSKFSRRGFVIGGSAMSMGIGHLLDVIRPDDEIETQASGFPVGMEPFIDDVLGGSIWSGQREIVRSVDQHKRTVVRSGYGAGKSRIAAKVAVSYLNTHVNSIVVTTAPTNRQVVNILWRYIRGEYSGARQPLLGRAFTQKVEISENWYAIGFKGDNNNSDATQGFHSDSALVIVDEAAGVSEQLLQNVDAILTGRNSRLLMIGNPTSTSGTFRDAFHEDARRYNQITISAFDTPNFTTFGLTLDDILSGEWKSKIAGKVLPYPALVDPEWVADIIEKHGIDHPYVQAAVFAKFPTGATNVLIGLDDIERAEYWESQPDSSQPIEAGVDVARTGSDETVVCIRQGNDVLHVESWQGQKTMESVGRVENILEQFKSRGRIQAVKVDVVGIGAGVADRLEEMGYPVIAVNVAVKSSDPQAYQNLRQEMWHQLRERFRTDAISFGNLQNGLDKETKSQLSDLRTKWNSRYTQVMVESKEEAKKRGSHSPDRAEAIALSFLQMPPEPAPKPGFIGVGIARTDW